MKKFISILFAIVLSLLLFTQAYGLETSGKSGTAYLSPVSDSTTVIDIPSRFVYGLKQGINKTELLNQYIETADGVTVDILHNYLSVIISNFIILYKFFKSTV